MASKLSDSANFIEELDISLNYAEKVYKSYIDTQKYFVFAKILFDVNSEINDLVKSNIRLLPESNRVDAYELIFHLDVWRSIWIQEVAKQKPQWDESFTFPNKVTFPKESVKRLLLLRKG